MGILIHHHDLGAFLKCFKDVPKSEIITLENGEADEFTMKINDVEVMVCAEHSHGIYWQVKEDHCSVKFEKMLVPCFSLTDERKAYEKLKMPHKVLLIDKFLLSKQ